MSLLFENYKEYRLENGLQVVLQKTSTETVNGGLNVWCGCLNEDPGEEGLVHFLEHCLATGGSEKYGAEEVKRIREMLGLNATTSNSNMVFPMDILSEELELYLALTSDIVFNPAFDEIKFEQERRRILTEISDAKGSPIFQDNEVFRCAMFGEASPYGKLPYGKEEVVAQATIADLRAIHDRGFGASNARLILVGGLPDNVEELIEKYFGDKPEGSYRRYEYPGADKVAESTFLHTSAPDLINRDHPESSTAGLNISFLCAPNGSEEEIPLRLLSSILSSRLFDAMSEKLGVYSINSEYGGTVNVGIISVTSRIPSLKYEEMLNAIFSEMKKLKEDPVEQYDLDRIKRRAKYNTVKAFEKNSDRKELIISYLEYGATPESFIDDIASVTPEQIRDVAQKYLPCGLYDGRCVVSLRDPLKVEEEE